MFEKASRVKLRYSTNRGVLSVEELAKELEALS